MIFTEHFLLKKINELSSNIIKQVMKVYVFLYVYMW